MGLFLVDSEVYYGVLMEGEIIIIWSVLGIFVYFIVVKIQHVCRLFERTCSSMEMWVFSCGRLSYLFFRYMYIYIKSEPVSIFDIRKGV